MALMYMSATQLVVPAPVVALCLVAALGLAVVVLRQARRSLLVLALLVALASGPVRAQEQTPPPVPPPPVIFYTCSYLEEYSLAWWLAGCWAVQP